MSEILFQKDPRWANIKLGKSAYYIWAKGCTITELAEAIGTTPDVINEKLNSIDGFALDKTGQQCLVIWAKIAEVFPGISCWRYWTYNNEDVLAQLAAGKKVIVEVPAGPIGGQGSHWVRYIGDHKLHDPWTGAERPTADFPNPTGYAVISEISGSDIAKEPEPRLQTIDAQANTYQGLNLNDLASVKAAVDTWHDVANGVYVRADEYVNLCTRICKTLDIDPSSSIDVIVEHIVTLKAKFAEQVTQAATIPAAQIEGQGPAVAPVVAPVVTLVNLPQHEKDAVLNQFQVALLEIRKLFGLNAS